MALITRSFEGVAPGTALTAANAGATQVVAGGTGASISFSDLNVHEGAGSAQFVSSGSNLCIARFGAAGASATMSYGIGFTVPVSPSVMVRFATLRGSSGPALNFAWMPDNSVTVQDRAFASTITVAGGLTPGRRYYLTVRATVGTSTTGSFTARVYDRFSALVGSAASTTYDLNTAALNATDVGLVNTNTTAGSTVFIDFVQLNEGSTTEVEVPRDAVYAGSLSLAGEGTQGRTVTPALSSALDATASGAQSREALAQLFAGLLREGAGDLNTEGRPSVRGTVTESASGVLTAEGAARLQQHLNRTTSAALKLLSAAGFPAEMDRLGTVTLTLDGHESKPLRARRVTLTTPQTEASLHYQSRSRTEVRVP